MAKTNLYVLINGTPVGILSQDEAGLVSFCYAKNYRGVPLSLSMPVRNRVYSQEMVRPYLFGLLPDSESQRRTIAQEYEVRPNNPVAMLEHIGLDCPGAVQFCPANEESLLGVIKREGEYVNLVDHDVAMRLKELQNPDDKLWLAKNEHWSLGGNLGKFALAFREGRWNSCRGSVPTTHIFKNGVAGFRLQALNEYVCMRCAAECQIPTAKVTYALFEDEPALIVKRLDRIEDGGHIERIHHEDLCQSLSVMPSSKYTSDGGPTAYDVLSLLATTGVHAKENLQHFTRYLFFNCLIGAPDAHAKNYSLCIKPGGHIALAPLYDVASGLAYEGMERKGRLAMAIGGENRFGRVGRGAVLKYASGGREDVGLAMEDAGLGGDACLDIMANLAQMVPRKLESVFVADAHIPGMDELRDHMLGPIVRNCERTLALL